MHRAVLTLVALLLIVSCGGTPGQSSGDPGPSRIQGTPFDGPAAAGAAIDGFTAQKDPNASFARIHELVRADPALIREAALRRLESQDPNVRFAAVYGLSLTAVEGPSADGLVGLLASDRANERLLAAAGLIPLGRRQALPVLIAALDDETLMDHRDPPKPAWAFARSLLLTFTKKDLGLAAAGTYERVADTKRAWEKWWEDAGASLVYESADRTFVETGQ